ncbi:hypothetical protein Baya_2420 [Bagarius yarrelli]|uniref:Uncharacterized protein n=1 Tax=Bagarius yarrelli TaxID=175774 RepID=A0A556TNZ1_BAGYA|nr:hypothetical protein Baya_2420 [Bagarius yarrelli]
MNHRFITNVFSSCRLQIRSADYPRTDTHRADGVKEWSFILSAKRASRGSPNEPSARFRSSQRVTVPERLSERGRLQPHPHVPPGVKLSTCLTSAAVIVRLPDSLRFFFPVLFSPLLSFGDFGIFIFGVVTQLSDTIRLGCGDYCGRGAL